MRTLVSAEPLIVTILRWPCWLPYNTRFEAMGAGRRSEAAFDLWRILVMSVRSAPRKAQRPLNFISCGQHSITIIVCPGRTHNDLLLASRLISPLCGESTVSVHTRTSSVGWLTKTPTEKSSWLVVSLSRMPAETDMIVGLSWCLMVQSRPCTDSGTPGQATKRRVMRGSQVKCETFFM